MSTWQVVRSPTDPELWAVQGVYLVADQLPIEDAAMIAAASDMLSALDEIMRPYGIYDCFISEQSLNPRLSDFIATGAKARAALSRTTNTKSNEGE